MTNSSYGFGIENPLKYHEITPALITNAYLYGTKNTPLELIDRISEVGDNGVTVYADTASYMKEGPGRYINPSAFNAISSFFDDTTIDIPMGEKKEFSKEELITILSLEESDFRSGGIQQYNYGENSSDYGSRVYIYNSTAYVINNEQKDLKFIIENINGGTIKSIENIRILPYDDNYDFESSDLFTTAGNMPLKAYVDPQSIGKTVTIEFSEKQNAPIISSYSWGDFSADQSIDYSGTIFSSISPILEIVHDLGEKGVLEYEKDGTHIIYGTEKNDTSTGSWSDDIMLGGSGNDTLNGSYGEDTALYKGAYSQYSITKEDGGYFSSDKIIIRDSIYNRDGTDTLTNIEYAQFSDVKLNLSTMEMENLYIPEDLSIYAGTVEDLPIVTSNNNTNYINTNYIEADDILPETYFYTSNTIVPTVTSNNNTNYIETDYTLPETYSSVSNVGAVATGGEAVGGESTSTQTVLFDFFDSLYQDDFINSLFSEEVPQIAEIGDISTSGGQNLEWLF